MSDEFLSIPEAADFLGICESTLRWYRAMGAGPRSWKAGRRVRYSRDDLVAWLDSQQAATARGGAA